MNKQLVLIAFKVILIFVLFCLPPCRADWQPYDWLVTISTRRVPNQFIYPGSPLTPLVLAHVSYARADGTDNASYETLWYCNGQPFGLERQGALNVTPGQGVAMRIVHTTSPAGADYQAAANSILRLYLDIRVHQSVPAVVIVPDQSFEPIITELIQEHFVVFEPSPGSSVQAVPTIFLQNSSNQKNQTLCYAPDSNGEQ